MKSLTGYEREQVRDRDYGYKAYSASHNEGESPD